MLGMAFKGAGFSVVQGGDVIFGGDVRTEHYPPGRFDGVISGPPCQAFSRLAHMVRHNGYEPKFGNLIPEFERVVGEAEPQWFVMENVPDAPRPVVPGYGVHSFLLNNRQLGETQNRVRRWSFGWRGERRVLLVDTQALEPLEFAYCGGESDTERKRTELGQMPWNAKGVSAFRESAAAQGLPDDFDLPAFTVAAKCQAVRNGVPIQMGLAIARAVREAVQGHAGA